MKNFDALNEKLAEMQKKFTEEGSKLFEEICQEIFEKYPELYSFYWTQYTPYFADGDECIFGVNEVSRINGYSDYDDDADEEETMSSTGEPLYNIFEHYSYDAKNKETKIVKDLNKFINDAPEEVLKAIYGDHCRVTIYRDKQALVEEYEHD